MNKSKVMNYISLLAIFFCTLTFSPQSTMANVDVGKAGDAIAALIPAIGLGSSVFFEEGNNGTVQFVKSLVASQAVTFRLNSAY